MTSIDKAEAFHALHQQGCFIIPNAWDAGSARILASMSFPAIATTSAGLAFMLGRPDGRAAVSRAEAMANAADIVGATTLPVSADLEDGYGPAPENCAETVHQAIAAGLCGCTIEDITADPASPIHSFDAALDRIRAAVAAARAAPYPFVLTARAENFLHGRADLDDTIRRLVAFAEAGADCLYAPALPDLAAIRSVVAAVSPKPVNVLANGSLDAAALAEAGVRRISVGGLLARAAYGAVLQAGGLLHGGNLAGAVAGVPSHGAIQALMGPKT